MPLSPNQQPGSRAEPSSQASLGMDGNDISFVAVWRTLLRRRRIVFTVLFLAFLAGVYLATRPRVYLATGTLQVRSGSSNKFRYEATALAGGDTDLDDRLESEVSVLESQSLFTKVAEQLRLAANPAILGKAANSHASMSDPVTQAHVLRALNRMIKVERSPKSEIITIRCTTASPLLSTQIVSTLMNEYVERIFENQFGSTQRAAKFLTAQLNDLKNQVLQDQQKLVDLQGKLGVVGFDDTHNLITAQLEDLARANEQADIARITAEARYRILEDERPDLVEGGPPLLSSNTQPASNASLLQTLRGAEAQLRSQYASVSEQFGPNYPETRQLKAGLAEASASVEKEQARILDQARVAYDAAASNQRMTQSALAGAEHTAFQKRNDMVQYEILLHEYQSSRALYEGLTQRLREAGVVSGLESDEIEVIDLPMLPISPTGYGPLTLIAISLMLGMVVAFIVATLVEATDTALHNVDEIERALGLPLFAVVPGLQTQTGKRSAARTNHVTGEPSSSAQQRLEVLRAPDSSFSEGVRLLRSVVLLAQQGHAPRSMLFTSAAPQEGKSTLCANLACVLAQNGARVLLVDANLRRPSQQRIFAVRNAQGLSDLLKGTATREECVRQIPSVPGLDLITAGSAGSSPGLLLASPAMRSFTAAGLRDYDFLILDSPPGLAIADASTLAALVDMVVLVIRDGSVTRKMILRVATLLTRAGANLTGFVFNAVERDSMEYYEYQRRGGYDGDGRYASTLGAADAE